MTQFPLEGACSNGGITSREVSWRNGWNSRCASSSLIPICFLGGNCRLEFVFWKGKRLDATWVRTFTNFNFEESFFGNKFWNVFKIYIHFVSKNGNFLFFDTSFLWFFCRENFYSLLENKRFIFLSFFFSSNKRTISAHLIAYNRNNYKREL